MVDLAKIRRETIRWQILVTLNNAQPIGTHENTVLRVIQAEFADSTKNELRRELDYLLERDLLKIDKHPDGHWHCKLGRYGMDVVDYTVAVEPGIARPEKYFDAQ